MWNNHILFRDYLNKHQQLIIEYSNLKKSLEKDFFDNRNNYAIGKNPFIEKVIETVKFDERNNYEYSDIKEKLKKGNKILFTRDSSCLQKLIRLIELQKHRTLVMWAFEGAYIPLGLFEEKYPNELRPRITLEMCTAWARGEVKMPVAKKSILDAHAVAKEIRRRCIHRIVPCHRSCRSNGAC